MKKLLVPMIVALIGFTGVNAYATCAPTDIMCYVVGAVQKFRVTSAGNVSIAGTLTTTGTSTASDYNTAGDIRLGVSGTAEPIAATSGNSQGIKIPVIIDDASAAVLEGSVLVVMAPTADGKTRVTLGGASNDLTTVGGIAASAGAAGATIDMYISGFVVALTTGTVNPGNTLVTTTNAAGYLTGDSTPTTGADVGVALSTGTASGGLTRILLYK